MLTKDTIKEDNKEDGRSMKALDVFAAVIKFFKDQLHQFFKNRHGDDYCLNHSDIHWVITAPPNWGLKAKRLMKDAAKQVLISCMFETWSRICIPFQTLFTHLICFCGVLVAPFLVFNVV